MKPASNVELKRADLKKAKAMVVDLVKKISCAPILVRLAWHDSGTYDMANKHKSWPNAGGAIGSIITDHEIKAGPNAGLEKAVPGVSWADLIQLAAATAIEVSGGPIIDMKY